MALADRIEGWRKDGLLKPRVAADFSPPDSSSLGNSGLKSASTLEAALAVPWKSNGLVASAVFFVLTCLAVAFTYFLFEVLHIPTVLVTFIAIAAAEALIIGQRWFGTGVESALWIGGLLAFVFSLPHSGKPEALLVIAAAFLLAGIRVRNALLITCAAILVIAYLGARNWPEAAMVSGVAGGLVALVASARRWRRPSTAMLWDVLLILVPLAGVVTGAIARGKIGGSWAIVFAAMAVAAFRAGVATREHAPLIAGFLDLCVVYGILEANDLLQWTVETQAIAGGLLMVAIAAAINRALRGRTRGITATPERMGELEELTQLAGAIHVQHGPEPAPAAPQPGGGGSFGGAGATGDY